MGAADSGARSAVADAGVSIEEITPDRVGGIASAAAVARLKALKIPFTGLAQFNFGSSYTLQAVLVNSVSAQY